MRHAAILEDSQAASGLGSYTTNRMQRYCRQQQQTGHAPYIPVRTAQVRPIYIALCHSWHACLWGQNGSTYGSKVQALIKTHQVDTD